VLAEQATKKGKKEKAKTFLMSAILFVVLSGAQKIAH